MPRPQVLGLSLFLAAGWAAAQGLPPGQTVVAVLPVVISAPGAAGASFHTAVQAYNPGAVPLTGSFLFRTGGPGASSSSPTLPYTIDPGQTISFVDLPDSMGQHNIGSLDVVASSGTEAPVLSVRIYNGTATSGTTGFTEVAKQPTDALSEGSRAVLVTPMDLTAFRFNVGIRTLDAGATVNLTLRDQAGNIRGILSRTFDSNAFEQFDARSFLGGLAPGPNDSITIDVVAGGLFVYGVSADNQTNDGAIQDAQKVSGM